MTSAIFGSNVLPLQGFGGGAMLFTGLHPVLTDLILTGLTIMVRELALKGLNLIAMGAAHRINYGIAKRAL